VTFANSNEDDILNEDGKDIKDDKSGKDWSH
jgi:hypothetical protein